MTYESLHTIPNWDTHEANFDTDDPIRDIYHPHNPRDTSHSWSSWPQGLYERVENVIRHSEHHNHQVHQVSTHKKICKREDILEGKTKPPDNDSEGSNIDLDIHLIIPPLTRMCVNLSTLSHLI